MRPVAAGTIDTVLTGIRKLGMRSCVKTLKLLLPGTLISVLALIGCSPRVTYLNAEESIKPAILFGKYEVSLSGWQEADGRYKFAASVNPLELISDTIDIDGLPILVIDSVCFALQPSRNPDCHVARSSFDTESAELADGRIESIDTLPARDLRYGEGRILLREFSLPDAKRIASELNGKVALTTIYARLVDRQSGETIGRDVQSSRYSINVRPYFVPES